MENPKQVIEALEENLRFKELATRISIKFIDLPVDKIDKAINDQLEEIGEFFNADRVTIAKLSEKGEVLEASHMWFSDKINVEKLMALMMGATYPNFTKHLKHKEYWSFSNPNDFSHWLPEKETIDKTKFKSGLAIKLSFDGSILETFVIDFMHSKQIWTQSIIEQVKLLGQIFSNALSRKRAELEVKQYEKFEKLVSEISTKFVGLSGVELEEAIQNELAEIAIFFDVDSVRLFRLSPQGDILKIRTVWRSRTHVNEDLSEVHQMKFPILASHYSQGKSVLFNKFEDSPQWPELRIPLKIIGTKAGVAVPLESDDTGVDVIAMDRVLLEHVWPKDIIMHCKTIGQVILGAIRRREGEMQIQKSFNEITKLKNRLELENSYLQEEIKLKYNFEKIIGQSSSLNYVLHRLEKVAPTNVTVLIGGETGTGKELFAHALHNTSPRKDKPLIKVNCAALPASLVESELFGHEKGAFTGADKMRIGRFELADTGTIFLDEISEMSLELQGKLLRVLQEGEFERLGSSKTIKVDVRVIAATNRILEKEIKEGRFREDLYYRLTVFVITIPPLRERSGDIPMLTKFFVNKFEKKHGKKIKKILPSALQNIQNYAWPGNIREMENVIEHGIIIAEKGVLRVEIPKSSRLSSNMNLKLEDVEKSHIVKVLKLTNWQIGGKGGAAEILGMKRTTLYARMKKYELSGKNKVESFRI